MRLIWQLLPFYSIFVISLFPILGVSGELVKKSNYVDIDQFITVEIPFDEGEALVLNVSLEAEGSSISLLLFKGNSEFERFKTSDQVDVDALRRGENLENVDRNYTVVGPFSKRNIHTFQEEIRIGDHDTYYVVISLYRNSSMSASEIVNRRAQVDYEISWEVEEKSIPWDLIGLAVVLFLIGIVLVIYYFWPRPPYPEEGDRSGERIELDNERRAGRKEPLKRAPKMGGP